MLFFNCCYKDDINVVQEEMKLQAMCCVKGGRNQKGRLVAGQLLLDACHLYVYVATVKKLNVV